MQTTTTKAPDATKALEATLRTICVRDYEIISTYARQESDGTISRTSATAQVFAGGLSREEVKRISDIYEGSPSTWVNFSRYDTLNRTYKMVSLTRIA